MRGTSVAQGTPPARATVGTVELLTHCRGPRAFSDGPDGRFWKHRLLPVRHLARPAVARPISGRSAVPGSHRVPGQSKCEMVFKPPGTASPGRPCWFTARPVLTPPPDFRCGSWKTAQTWGREEAAGPSFSP